MWQEFRLLVREKKRQESGFEYERYDVFSETV